MFSTTRLRLTAWYLLILTLIVGLLSIALYRLVHQVQQSDILIGHPNRNHYLADIFAHESAALVSQIIALDVGLLVVAAAGAYLLAGRTLRPIEDVAERQRRFAAAASHELRTPLTALRGSVEVALLQRRSIEEYEKVLRATLHSAEHMSDLVHDLTLLARPIADATLIRRERLDLASAARDAIHDIHSLAVQKDHKLEVNLNGALFVDGDMLKLRQVIVNLLDNAVTYTPSGGIISVTGRKEHGKAMLEVRDTGPGIPPEHAPHLFVPFYRADAGRGDTGHSGLGLALSDWTVRAHDGKLAVVSRPGAGTVFVLSLPLAL